MNASALKTAALYHLASGDAFFSGSALIVVSVLISAFTQSRWSGWCSRVGLAVGVLFVTLSVTPLAMWMYAGLAIVIVAWLLVQGSTRLSPRWRTVLAAATTIAWTGAAFWELPYHRAPVVKPIARPVVGVLGDSVTAGIDEGRYPNWPRTLVDEHGHEVRDYSKVAATTRSSQSQAEQLDDDVNLLIIEIGGNDLLGTSSASVFERDLDALLSMVAIPGRTVMMFELPLLPFCHRYGLAQRRLCHKYGVLLIPKYLLLEVLLTDGATSDTIHLTAAGHERLTAEVWKLLEPAVAPR